MTSAIASAEDCGMAGYQWLTRYPTGVGQRSSRVSHPRWFLSSVDLIVERPRPTMNEGVLNQE
jgi:hypothetical protein